MAKKIIKAENTQKKAEKKIEKEQGVSDDSMAKLARIMSDAPSLVKLAGTEWEIRGLKPAVQWEIARLACEIKKVESATYGDILQDLAKNIPTVVRIITLALLNDKRRIEEEFDIVYDTLMWESNVNEFATLLFEILELQDVSFFFSSEGGYRDVSSDDFGEEDEDDGRTEMIYATSEYGQMIDFLRANTFVTREEYMWQWTIPQIRIASADFTHVRYLSEKQKKMKDAKVFGKNNGTMLNDLGIPILGEK